jgi:hypothetical protein
MRSPGRSKIALYITSLKKNGVVHHSKIGSRMTAVGHECPKPEARCRLRLGSCGWAGLCAMCGRLQVGKENLHVAAGRCGHVFGLLVRFT